MKYLSYGERLKQNLNRLILGLGCSNVVCSGKDCQLSSKKNRKPVLFWHSVFGLEVWKFRFRTLLFSFRFFGPKRSVLIKAVSVSAAIFCNPNVPKVWAQKRQQFWLINRCRNRKSKKKPKGDPWKIKKIFCSKWFNSHPIPHTPIPSC